MQKNLLLCVCWTIFLVACERINTKCNNIYIDTTSTLYAFYPKYREMKWKCSRCPDMDNDSIIFCCTATFSKDYSLKIEHDKICGSHIIDGVFYNGYQNHLINGAFVFAKGSYTFLHDSINYKLRTLEGEPNTFAFCQMRLDTTINTIPPDSIYFEEFGLRGYKNLEGRTRLSKTRFKYRALCEKENKLCVVVSKKSVTLTQFRKNLKDYGLTHALYLDTGLGWSHSWYRGNDNKVHILHPHVHPFNTNWLIFYK